MELTDHLGPNGRPMRLTWSAATTVTSRLLDPATGTFSAKRVKIEAGRQAGRQAGGRAGGRGKQHGSDVTAGAISDLVWLLQ